MLCAFRSGIRRDRRAVDRADRGGQMSNAVTLAVPCWAAAIPTTPPPVHRSNTCWPAEMAALVNVSIRSHELCCGAQTKSAATILPEESVTVAVIEDSRRLGGALMCVVG
jgi:hypothetical protein